MAMMHPQAEARLARIAASGEPPLETLPPAEARRLADERVTNNGFVKAAMHDVRDIAAPGPAGPIGLRLYQPTDRTDGPLILFFHGGGFMVGNLETHDALCRAIAARAGVALLAIDYRRAPEDRFPAAAEDCCAAARWALEHGAALGVDTHRYALVGESSGGNMTAVVAQDLRAAGAVPARLQVMIYPMLDMDTDTPSYRAFTDGYFFTRAKSRYFIDHYLRTPADADDPRASPLRAASLADLPPALIITAGLDPLLSEAEDYADRLGRAGVPVEYHRFDGWPHGFMFWGDADACHQALDITGTALRTALV